MPFIKTNAHKKYNLTQKQIAISCASHCGETTHLKVLQDWVKKLNINKNLLKCGTHNPLNSIYSDKLLLSGEKPNELHNNCAGKHLGMISGCIMHDFNLKNYLEMNHPYQKLIRESLEYFTEKKITAIQKGIDGCSAPQYAFPLKNLSISMINLLKNLNENKFFTTDINLIISAISKYPALTGSNSIYSTQLMSLTNGKFFAKGGAEGVLLFAHKEKKIGGIVKVVDGNERALPSIANTLFKKLDLLNNRELGLLSKWTNQKIYNHAKLKIGEIYTDIK